MSIKKANISRQKKDIFPSKFGYLGTKNIRFNHQASAGDTSFDLNNLTNGISGFINPQVSDLSNAQTFKNNLRIFSSLGYELIPQQDYVVNGSVITFINDMGLVGAQEGEIFFGELMLPTSNAIVADAEQKIQTYTLAQGTTTLSLGRSFRLGEIQVYRNGKIQVAGASNNYVETDSGNGYGTQIVFNTANASADDSIVVVFGLVYAGDIQIFDDLERLAGSVLALAQDMALVTENPVEDYITATPSEVERDTFGTQHLGILNLEIDTIEKQRSTFAPPDSTNPSYAAQSLGTETPDNDYGSGLFQVINSTDIEILKDCTIHSIFRWNNGTNSGTATEMLVNRGTGFDTLGGFANGTTLGISYGVNHSVALKAGDKIRWNTYLLHNNQYLEVSAEAVVKKKIQDLI